MNENKKTKQNQAENVVCFFIPDLKQSWSLGIN